MMLHTFIVNFIKYYCGKNYLHAAQGSGALLTDFSMKYPFTRNPLSCVSLHWHSSFALALQLLQRLQATILL